MCGNVGTSRASQRRQRRRAQDVPSQRTGKDAGLRCRQYRRRWNLRHSEARRAHEGFRAEFARRLPFDADVMICDGSEISGWHRQILFLRDSRPGRRFLQFAGVMGKRKHLPAVPLVMPPAGAWSLRIVSVHGRMFLGVCRREMKAIVYLLRGAPKKDRRCARHDAELEHNTHYRADFREGRS